MFGIQTKFSFAVIFTGVILLLISLSGAGASIIAIDEMSAMRIHSQALATISHLANDYRAVPAITEAPPQRKTIINKNDSDWSLVVGAERSRFSKKDQLRTREIIRAAAESVGASADAIKLLNLVASRESSFKGNLNPLDGKGISHNLSQDVEAVTAAKYRLRDVYKLNNKYRNNEIWKSYGLYGMNSPLFLYVWDKDGDPRMLGDSVIGTLVYLRSARSKLRKMENKVRCKAWDDVGIVNEDINGNYYKSGNQKVINGEKVFEFVEVYPTWINIHRAVSGGKMCPAWSGDEMAKIYNKKFRNRAQSFGLDPDRIVSESEFGIEPANENQYALWKKIWKNSGSIL